MQVSAVLWMQPICRSSGRRTRGFSEGWEPQGEKARQNEGCWLVACSFSYFQKLLPFVNFRKKKTAECKRALIAHVTLTPSSFHEWILNFCNRKLCLSTRGWVDTDGGDQCIWKMERGTAVCCSPPSSELLVLLCGQGGSTEELLSAPLCAAAQGKWEQTSAVELGMIIEAVKR